MLSQQLSLLLTQQRLLNEKTLEKNLDIGSKAWYDGSTQGAGDNLRGRFVFNTTISVTSLADMALEAWQKIYSLGNAQYTIGEELPPAIYSAPACTESICFQPLQAKKAAATTLFQLLVYSSMPHRISPA